MFLDKKIKRGNCPKIKKPRLYLAYLTCLYKSERYTCHVWPYTWHEHGMIMPSICHVCIK